MTISFRRLCLITEMVLVVGAAVACGAGGATEEADGQRNFAWATVTTGLGGPPTRPPAPPAPTPTPAPPPAPACTLTLTAMINAHVRSRPGEAPEHIIDTLPAGESAPVVGRLPAEPKWTASPWWLIRLDAGRYGWIGSDVVILDGCPVALEIVSPVPATN